MARNYAALPWDYLEEMDALEDGEFGRLARALIRYSMTGEPIALTGNERFFAKRVMAQEDRYQESYRKQSAQNARNGASGGRPRKNGGTQSEGEGDGRNQNKPKKSKNNRSEADETQKTQTKTETDTEKDYYDDDDKDAHAHAEEPDCVRYFLNNVNPNAPQRDLDEMAQLIRQFNEHSGDGNGMVIRACDLALSNRVPRWRYISTCLSNWLKAGIYTPAALDAAERDRRQRQDGYGNGNTGGAVPQNQPSGRNAGEDTFEGRRFSTPIPV